MKIKVRRTPRGFSMLEVSLAFTVLAVALIPILSVVFGTNRLQNRSTGVFREAVAAQLVWESIKGQNQVNETFLRDLGTSGFVACEIDDPRQGRGRVAALVHLGAFVERDGPLDEGGRPLPVSPLVSFLFNHTGGVISDPVNRTPLDIVGNGHGPTASELSSLRRNFQDLAFRVTVIDGMLPVWPDDRTAGKAKWMPTDLVKEVWIDVMRVGPDRRVSSTYDFRVEGALETPAGSLAPSRLRYLTAKRDGYSYDRDFREAYGKVAPDAFEERQPEYVARALSNVLLIVVEAVGESIMSEGRDFGFGIRGGNGGRGSEYWVDQALSKGTNLCRVVAADLCVEKARGILAAYRHSERPMKELAVYANDFGRRLLQALDEFEKAKTQVAKRPEMKTSLGNSLKARWLPTLKETVFWLKFFGQERYARSMLWPGGFPRRFEGEALARAQDLYARVEADTRSTPMDRMRALNAYVEVVRARKLFLDRARLPEERLISDRASEYRNTMPPYSEALLADEVFSLQALVNRNVEFHRVSAGLRRIGEPDHPYQVILRNLHPSGGIGRAERRLQAALDFFGSGVAQGNLTGDLSEDVSSSVTIIPSTAQKANSGAVMPVR